MKIFVLIYFCVFCHNALGKTWENLNAAIAVVEYSSDFITKDKNHTAITLQNANNYKNIVNNITDTDLKMVIFPECTLSSSVSEAVSILVNSTPWDSDNYPEFIKIVSLVAKEKNIHIIVNLDEKSTCTKDESGCPDKGYYIYNTDVIFDNNGTIVNRYRKYNLFGEYSRNKPESAEEITFEAFGLTFGIFTCFDLLFKTPTEILVEEQIDAAIFPTMWFSELPFLTGVQAQQMWSQAHNTPLFAAGANNPEVGSGGTGVYNGDQGAVDAELLALGGTEAFVIKIKNGEFVTAAEDYNIDKLSKDMDGFFLKTDDSIPDFSSQLLNVSSEEEVSQQVCYGKEEEFCCNFNIDFTTSDSTNGKNIYVYHLVAFSDIRSFTGVYNGGVDLCGIIACLNSSLTSCGLRFPDSDNVSWLLTFNKISISAKFENTENKTQYPNSLLSSIRPIDVSKTTWEESQEDDDGFITRTFATTHPHDRLLTFAIYGRDFSLDSEPKPKDDDKSSVEIFGINMLLLLISLMFTFLVKN